VAAEQYNRSAQLRCSALQLYEQYEKALKELGSLDFDDLLVYGLKLLQKEKHVVSSVRHVLVDEFQVRGRIAVREWQILIAPDPQDTNTTQYNLMKAFAKKGHVTIVGDPDQSIYSWRAAGKLTCRRSSITLNDHGCHQISRICNT
jgi:DNA helicase-2/ATP-dependent DNA helicase PcrA